MILVGVKTKEGAREPVVPAHLHSINGPSEGTP